MRLEFFGRERASIFADEQSLAFYVLALRMLESDAKLSEHERAKRREVLDQRFAQGRLAFGVQ